MCDMRHLTNERTDSQMTEQIDFMAKGTEGSTNGTDELNEPITMSGKTI